MVCKSEVVVIERLPVGRRIRGIVVHPAGSYIPNKWPVNDAGHEEIHHCNCNPDTFFARLAWRNIRVFWPDSSTSSSTLRRGGHRNYTRSWKMALLENTHAMYAAAVASPYLMNSRLAAAMGANGDHNGYMSGRFPTIEDVRIGASVPNSAQSSSSNRSSTSPLPLSRQTIDEESSPTHQTVLNATMSLKLESASHYHRQFAHSRSSTFRPFSSNSPDVENHALNDENRRDYKVSFTFYFIFSFKTGKIRSIFASSFGIRTFL